MALSVGTTERKEKIDKKILKQHLNLNFALQNN
jgi:hypothetical protein